MNNQPKQGWSPRDQLISELMKIYRPFMMAFPDERLPDVMEDRYDVREVRLLSVEQVQDFVGYLKRELAEAEDSK